MLHRHRAPLFLALLSTRKKKRRFYDGVKRGCVEGTSGFHVKERERGFVKSTTYTKPGAAARERRG
jgi:hypothetical protein